VKKDTKRDNLPSFSLKDFGIVGLGNAGRIRDQRYRTDPDAGRVKNSSEGSSGESKNRPGKMSGKLDTGQCLSGCGVVVFSGH
jgi:hypothetical protein